MPSFSRNLEETLHRAVAFANQRKHEYATLEHLLLALNDDQDAAAVMNACDVDMAALKKSLINYLDTELTSLIVEDGEDSGNFHRLVTVIADLALLPFALALGLDFFITAGRVFGEVAGGAAGTAATAVAVGFWYGFPRVRKRYTGEQERAVTSSQTQERSSTPLHAEIEQMLTEARVVLPGAQALFGFQLAIVLTQSFE